MDYYLLPGVESQGSYTDLFYLLVTGSKQQIPVRSTWQGYLKKRKKETSLHLSVTSK